MYGSSRRVSRRRPGAITARIATSASAAPSDRTCARRSDERPVERMVFEIPPLMPQRTAAVAAIGWPRRGRLRRAGSTGNGASLIDRRTYLVTMELRRDVGVVLSGGGVNGVMMELGFLQRLRESVLWPRVAAIFGTSSGALSGSLAALDRLDDLERFLLALQPEQTFRPNRLWQLPFLGLHDYALPQTLDIWFGGMTKMAEELATALIELVVVATDISDEAAPEDGFELVYSSRVTPPAELAQAILASAAVSA